MGRTPLIWLQADRNRARPAAEWGTASRQRRQGTPAANATSSGWLPPARKPTRLPTCSRTTW